MKTCLAPVVVYGMQDSATRRSTFKKRRSQVRTPRLVRRLDAEDGLIRSKQAYMNARQAARGLRTFDSCSQIPVAYSYTMAELGSRAWLDYRNLILIGHRTRTVLRTAQTLIGEEFASYRADAVPGKDPDPAGGNGKVVSDSRAKIDCVQCRFDVFTISPFFQTVVFMPCAPP